MPQRRVRARSEVKSMDFGISRRDGPGGWVASQSERRGLPGLGALPDARDEAKINAGVELE
jgi:hypothetical protein